MSRSVLSDIKRSARVLNSLKYDYKRILIRTNNYIRILIRMNNYIMPHAGMCFISLCSSPLHHGVADWNTG